MTHYILGGFCLGSGTQYCFAVPFRDFKFPGMDIYQGMLTVAVGTVTVICEVARYKYIRAIENIQFFHIQVEFMVQS